MGVWLQRRVHLTAKYPLMFHHCGVCVKLLFIELDRVVCESMWAGPSLQSPSAAIGGAPNTPDREQVHAKHGILFQATHLLKLSKSLSWNNLLRQASASPRWRMNPANAMISFIPLCFPFSSVYKQTSQILESQSMRMRWCAESALNWEVKILYLNPCFLSRFERDYLHQRFRFELRRGLWQWWVCWWLSTFLECRYPQYFLRRLACLL